MKIEQVGENIALLCLHEISPAFEDDVVETCDCLSGLGMISYTLLVTPFYGLKKINSFTEHPMFAKYLSSLDLELSMHGYAHFTKSGALGEFRRMKQDQAISKMQSGIRLIKTAFGRKPTGFVPPAWSAPKRLTKAVKELGLEYCVIGDNLYSFTNVKIYSTTEHIMSHGTPGTPLSQAMLEIELGGPLQIGIHPFDYKSNNMLEVLGDMKDRLGYRFIGYRDYLLSQKRDKI